MNYKHFKILCLIYLSLPNILFYLGWLNLTASIISVFCLLFCLFSVITKNNKSEDDKLSISFNNILLVFGITLILGYLLGMVPNPIGQSLDYYKHNLIAKELIIKNNPVVYEKDIKYGLFNEPAMLGYYLAYYLPTAYLSKLVGINFSDKLLYIWGCFGLLLSFIGIYFIANTKINIYKLILIFLVITTPFKAFLFCYNSFSMNILALPRIDYFIGSSAVLNNALNITYAPQHYISMALGCILIYKEGFIKKDLSFIVFVFSQILLWSFLVGFALSLLVFFIFVKNKFKNAINLSNVASLFLILVSGFYILAHFKNISFTGFIWDFESSGLANTFPLSLPIILVIYYFLEIGILIFFINSSLDKNHKHLMIFITILFLIAPLYRVGLWNDPAMRLITVLKMLLFLTILTNIESFKIIYLQKYLVKYFIQSITVLGIISIFLVFSYKFQIPSIANTPALEKANIEKEIYMQYFAKKDSFFGKYLLKNTSEH